MIDVKGNYDIFLCIFPWTKKYRTKRRKIRICRSIALFNDRESWISNIAYSTACEALNVIARSCLQRRGNLPEGNLIKSHARYFCTCVEKRSTQAKEWALLLAIMWFQKCSVRRIARKGHRIIKPTQDTCTCVEKSEANKKRGHLPRFSSSFIIFFCRVSGTFPRRRRFVRYRKVPWKCSILRLPIQGLSTRFSPRPNGARW